MSRNFVVFVSFAVLALCVTPCWATPINVLLNGDFETNVGTAKALSTGLTGDLANWTVSGTPGAWWLAKSGSPPPSPVPQHLNWNVDCAGTAQTITSDAFAVTANTTYTLSLWQQPRSGGDTMVIHTIITGSGGMQLNATQGNMASITGSGTSTVTWTQGNTVASWVNYTATFVPSLNGNVTLAFSNGTGGSYGQALDNVTVTYDSAVPEPGTLALLAAGLAGLLCYAWRKQR
jgi:hypothetical protein